MSCEEKLQTLETIISPFGYCYDPARDYFSTTLNAPQRTFGYTALYDRYAPCFGMVFDCLPVYFDYRGRTWLIEIWKGQYGINAGCEIGVYKAEGLVTSLMRKTALFQSVGDEELLPMFIQLYQRGTLFLETCRRHWWLTAFRMGAYCEPRELEVQAGITFPNAEMQHAFVGALRERGDVEFSVRGLQVGIRFCACTSCELPWLRRIRCRYEQWKNRILCKLFNRVTRPFTCGMDQLLDLYYCLPRLIRCVFCFGKRRRCHKKSCRCCHKRSCKRECGRGNQR